MSGCHCCLVPWTEEGAALRPAEMLQPLFFKKVSGPSTADQRCGATTLFVLLCQSELMIYLQTRWCYMTNRLTPAHIQANEVKKSKLAP